jgi:hypothetical protein
VQRWKGTPFQTAAIAFSSPGAPSTIRHQQRGFGTALFLHRDDRPDLSRRLTIVHQPRKLPLVLSVEEVARLLATAMAAGWLAVGMSKPISRAGIPSQGRLVDRPISFDAAIDPAVQASH